MSAPASRAAPTPAMTSPSPESFTVSGSAVARRTGSTRSRTDGPNAAVIAPGVDSPACGGETFSSTQRRPAASISFARRAASSGSPTMTLGTTYASRFLASLSRPDRRSTHGSNGIGWSPDRQNSEAPLGAGPQGNGLQSASSSRYSDASS